MASVTTVVVSCMDRRLSSFLDSTYGGSDTVFVRNAGANVFTATNTIKQLAIEFPIKEIIIAPHTNCGAMGLVYDAVKNGTPVSPQVEGALVAQFRKRKFKDRSELENGVNGEVQGAAISSFAKVIGATVDIDLIDINRIDIPEDDGRHILTLTKPTSTSYQKLIERYKRDKVGVFNSYFIQARGMRDVMPDIEIAVSALHISDVRLVSESVQQNAIMAMDMKHLRGQKYLNGAKISLIKYLQK